MATTTHALLGASKASRWLACTPSAVLESKFPNKTSIDAETGTLAHACVEEKLDRIIAGKARGRTSTKLKKHKLWFDGMEDFVDIYVDEVLKTYDQLKADGKYPVMFSERTIDYSDWVPSGFGTTDTVIIADETMYVYDFKFGKGVRVSAHDNPQLRLYALGAYNEFSILYDVENIVMNIVQPRIDDGFSSETITVTELLDWADNFVRPRAELAAKGEGDCVEGDHCRFCLAKSVCKARAYKFIQHLKETEKDPKTLSESELATILPVAKYISGWATELEDYMTEQAVAGTQYPGYKIVAGNSKRKITDEGHLADALLRNGFDRIYRLQSLTDLEKQVGKRKLADIGGAWIVRPQGKPTLAPESDPRPVLANVMFNDEEEEIEDNG